MRCRDILADQIKANGPLHIDQFMQTALSHPEHGYYAGQDRFGSQGDFITAPEVSQLFGEMMAGFLAYLWQASGQPDAPRMIRFEAGPGRGTLFADMHKTCQKICPPLSHADPYFLEASPYLRRRLAEKIAPLAPLFCDQIAQLPPKPLFGIANEFFDALGVRQACFRRGEWIWRMIDIEKGRFIFTDGAPLRPSEQESAFLPVRPKEGDIYEISPMSESFMAEISRHIAYHGGGFLICDYGKSDGHGDSLQAVKSHTKAKMLESPGEADITHLVDFSALARQAKAMGARLIGPVEQGAFLTELGINARAEALRKAGQPETDRLLLAALERLCAPAHMGQIFKVALLVPAGDGLPPGFATIGDTA
jgi:NADH dehydrogenase [ubiquinone] 1 alpha subcomplex assembly factor 7